MKPNQFYHAQQFIALIPIFLMINQGVQLFSSRIFFRVMLIKYQQGVWLDTDVYLVKQFHPDADKVWLAKGNNTRVGVFALYFPPNNPIIKVFEDYWAGTEVISHWLGFKRCVWRPF